MVDTRPKAGPKHTKAAHFLQKRLFHDLSSFGELERRITELPETEHGDAFEVFVEAYLATCRFREAQEVWPWNRVPLPILDELFRRTGRDVGVDGVFRTRANEYHAYQAKFRNKRSTLTHRELSTFLAVAEPDKLAQRVVITNCDAISPDSKKCRKLYCILGYELDRLESRDFKEILAWLDSRPFQQARVIPRDYQLDAVEALTGELQNHDRATALMACGTSKTQVALWAAERMQPHAVLVLVPSLALLKQTREAWLKGTNWDRDRLRTLCVCSDPSVGEDFIFVDPKEAGFAVNTESKNVRAFLQQEGPGVKVVFSTYQSARVVADGMRPGEWFDVGIFDEAHRTAGKVGRDFSFALDDESLRIRKRLFFTATPRHYDYNRRRHEDQDPPLVYSMHDEEVYGNPAYKLPFAKAAERGIICNCRVIVSVVDSSMVDPDKLPHSEVLVSGEPLSADYVARQLALAHGIKEHGIRKVFTFHRTVRDAEAFTSEGARGIRQHLHAPFDTRHVSGEMNAGDREKRIRQFADADCAILSNARCLTEGVNVPEVEMVAFMSPKRSRVDIVQAAGRAMRRSSDGTKAVGWILVPLFVDKRPGESLEAAIGHSDFREVFEVLGPLMEQDDILEDIIREMREDRGRTRGFSDSRLREKVEVLWPGIGLEDLRLAITTRCLDRLGRPWDEHFGELKKFKEENGHCRVPQRSALGQFVANMRKDRKAEKLSAERVRKLNEIGFAWDALEAEWEERIAQLEDFKKVHSHCNVSSKWPANPALARWVNSLRNKLRRGAISPERVKQLTEMGFSWDRPTEVWEESFRALLAYKEAHGDCNVPLRWSPNKKLGLWVQTQRRRRASLDEGRIRRLEEAGFVWDTRTAEWERNYRNLAAYREEKGNCLVPAQTELGRWVDSQRREFAKDRMSQERLARLGQLGLELRARPRFTAKWEEGFALLLKYRKENGDCDVPQKHPNYPTLGAWVSNQRMKHRKSRLNDDQVGRLEAIGFKWKAETTKIPGRSSRPTDSPL
jgi:superfamily II DNA or RNA helicase